MSGGRDGGVFAAQHDAGSSNLELAIDEITTRTQHDGTAKTSCIDRQARRLVDCVLNDASVIGAGRFDDVDCRYEGDRFTASTVAGGRKIDGVFGRKGGAENVNR